MRLFKSNSPALQKTVFILIAILGVTYIYHTWRSTEEDKFDQTRLTARSFVASLPIDVLKVLEAIPGDIDKPQYQVIKNALKELISINTTARFAYILTERNDRIYYIADSESEGSINYSPPGQEHTEDKLIVRQPFRDGKEQVEVSITDRLGKWTSVLVPVKDKITGKTIAVLGMDFNAKSWFNSIFIEVTKSSVLILLLLATLVLLYLINTKNKILKGHITKLLQAENELKKQKEEFEMIFNLVPAQIWYKDTHNSFIRVNRQVCTDLGLTENEITGHAAEEIFPSFAQKYFDDDLEVFNSGRPKLDVIEQINTCAGKLKWVHTDKYPVFGIDGELVGLVAFTQDITLRKMTEDALLKSETQLRTLVQTIPDLMWLKDNNGVYLQCNTMFEHFFGARETDILGKTDYDFIDKDLADFFRDHDRKAMAAGKPTTNEEWITFADDGHRAYLETIKTPMYESDGKLIGILGIGRDITDRKMAEDALSSSEVRLRTLLQTSPDLILIKDTRGVYLGCNSMCERYFGAIEADIIGKTDYDFVDKELADSFCENDHKAMEAGRPTRNAEWITFADDGHSAYLDTIKAPLYDSNGTLIGMMGIGRDISEHKKAEDALKASEEKYRTIFENVQDVFYQTDLAGIITEISPSIKYFSEFSRDEIIDTPVYNLYYNLDDRKILLDAIIENGELRDYVLRIKTKTGKIKFVSVNARLISDSEGSPHHIDGALRDITDRKHAESELLEREIQYRNLANSGLALIWTSGTDKLCNYFNEPWLTFTGRTLEQELGNGWAEGVHYDDLDRCLKTYIDAFDNREALIMEYRLRNASGDYRWIEDLGVPNYKSDGEFIGYLGHCFDITEQKSLEYELMKAKNKAEESDRLKSAFLANMSHEIRTPLNSIVGFSSILKEKLTGQNLYTEYLDNILLSSKILINLISDILDLSKVEAGKMVIDLQPVNLNSIVDEIQTVFRMKATEKGLLLNVKVYENIPGSLITDERYLRQILFNLIGNAVKFTHKGSINLEVRIIPSDIECCKIDLKFIIKDTGIGIPTEQLNSIFEPFIQASKKDRNRYGGTGLGLSITKRLIELLGGTISVVSEIDKGSEFSFCLFNVEIGSILYDEFKNIETNQTPLEIKFRNPVLLLVEDILSNRDVVKAYLESLNITIIEAENGEECLSAIQKQRPDLILMDMQMPVMDGYTAINIIKSDDSLKNIPIIALTASGMKQQKNNIKNIADDFLIKPIYKDKLILKLMKYLTYENIKELKINQEIKSNELFQAVIQKSLSPEMKEKITYSYIPTITKLINTLNIDEIIDFVKEMEEFNKNEHISELSEYCILLTSSIQSFNIEKISITLEHLLLFIKK